MKHKLGKIIKFNMLMLLSVLLLTDQVLAYNSNERIMVFNNNTIIGILIVIIIAFILIIFVIMKSKGTYEKQFLDKYNIITNIFDEVIFSYEYKKDELTLPIKYASSKNLKEKSKHFLRDLNTVYANSELSAIGTLFTNNVFNNRKQVKNLLYEGKNVKKWFKVEYIITYDEQKHPLICIGKLLDISKDYEETKQFRTMVQLDGLTSIYNKITAEIMIREYLRNGEGSVEECALFVIDADNFKAVNDNLGHAKGDEVIKDIATIIQNTVRIGFDIAGRIGGDEFIILYKSIKQDMAIRKANEIIASFNEKFSEFALPVTCSIGIAFYPKDDSSFDELFIKADLAMYEAKRQNKGIYTFYDESLSKNAISDKKTASIDSDN